MTPTSAPHTVSWRKSVAAVLATMLALSGLVVMLRSNGLEATDVAGARALRWFVHQPSGRVALVDGYAGRVVASIDTGVRGDDIKVAEARPGAYLLNEDSSEVREIDGAALRLGSPLGLTTLGSGSAVSGVSAGGLVVVDPDADQASLLAGTGAPISYPVVASASTLVATDGAVWSLVDRRLQRVTSTQTTDIDVGSTDVVFTMVGTAPFVLDPASRRARFGEGRWVDLPGGAPASEFVVQAQGPAARCGWVVANDDLWCVGTDGIVDRATIDGLDADGSDLLGVAGDAAVLLRRGPDEIVRFDWRTEQLLPSAGVSIPAGASLSLSPMVDIIWIDDTTGDFVWTVTPWGVRAVDKDGAGVLVLGEQGDLVDEGQSSGGTGNADADVVEPEVRDPDDNGIDDPPVAVDDQVTARSGSPVPVQATANDYDPDGEAVAVSDVGRPGHGSADIVTGSTIVYSAEPGYVGPDSFEYTIVDGNGTPASATVFIEMLPVEATNRPPRGTADSAATGPDRPVVIDVLLNDVDPERDALRIASFTPPPSGEVSETVGPSGLAALRFEPPAGFEGSVSFSYQPMDALGAVGAEVSVDVEVARRGGANRAPILRPDSARIRRGVVQQVPVLANDIDPDGDDLVLRVAEPLPEGLRVQERGQSLDVLVSPGAANLLPFEYLVDDGAGNTVRGSVLVIVVDDDEPNRGPLASPDFGTAVVGQSVLLDVLLNDVDPDGDPLVVTSVQQPEGRGQAVVVGGGKVQFTPSALVDVEEAIARFTYEISDGNGHVAVGDIVVNVIPEPVAAPPYAQDDSTSTFVNEPVTIDVLRNDGDPSGERPVLVGTPGCPGGGSAVVTTNNQVRYDPPPGQVGAFRCTYEVTNSQGLRDAASIIISVRPRDLVNRPPIAVTDEITVTAGTSASVDLTANDSDPDGPNSELTVVSSTAPTLGTAVRNGNTLTFTAGSVLGDTRINYEVSDAGGAITLGRVVIKVVAATNTAPIATPDARTIFGPGTPTSFDVLANDFDPDSGDSLSVVSVSRTSGNGSVTLSGRVVTISPDPNFVGDVIVSYTIADRGGLTARSQVTLTVLKPLNRPPSAADDFVEVASGGSVTLSPLFNDTDPDGDQLNLLLTGTSDPSVGSATLNADRSVTFTSAPGASGATSVGYTVSDGEFTASAAIRVVVRPCAESAPVALNPVLRTGYQQPIRVDLAEYSANGVVVDVSGPPTYSGNVYTPPSGENGNVTISFAVVNGCRQRATGRVTIDVNQDPLPQSQSIAIGRSEFREIAVSALASDAEPLVISGSSGEPSWVSVTSDRVIINPPQSVAVGSFSWTVTVRDPGGLTAQVPITVTIANRAPVTAPDTIDASSGNPVDANIVSNDNDPDGPNGQLRIQSIPGSITFENGQIGTVVVSANGRTVTVDPRSGAGTATFTYTVVDTDGAVSAPALVTVVGPRLNRPPFANDQSVTVQAGAATPITLDAGDPDGPPFEVIDLGDPGGVVVSRSGIVLTVSAAEGTYEVTYRLSDGIAVSRLATVTIQVAPPPTTVPDTTTTTAP